MTRAQIRCTHGRYYWRAGNQHGRQYPTLPEAVASALRRPYVARWRSLWDDVLTYRREYVPFPAALVSGRTSEERRNALINAARTRGIYVDTYLDDPDDGTWYVRMTRTRSADIILPPLREDW